MPLFEEQPERRPLVLWKKQERKREMKKMFRLKYLLIGVVLLLFVGVFLVFGPPQMLARTETPEYCASCHVMESQYEAWQHQGAHRRHACVACHLPHDNVVSYYVWKGIDGMKDLIVFHSGMVPERIEISNHGRGFIQDNCIRCHAKTVEKMLDKERQCWNCHRDAQHRLTGSRLTL